MGLDKSKIRASLLLTGDELLRGFVQDANSIFIAKSLRNIGIELSSVEIIGDQPSHLHRAINALVHDINNDLIIITGGLGPTHDDRTTEVLSKVLDLELEFQKDALRFIEERLISLGRMNTQADKKMFASGNLKQATFPLGAYWLNPLGTAPGYVLASQNQKVIMVLPGPPAEMKYGFSGALQKPLVQDLLSKVQVRSEKLLRIWGVSETYAAQVLRDLEHEDTDACQVTLCAREGELELSLRGEDEQKVFALFNGLKQVLSSYIFAVDDDRSIVDIVAEKLQKQGMSVGLAESCTGGMLGEMFTSVSGASSFFYGGLVTYSNSAKVCVGNVDARLIDQYGAVSKPVACAMAQGAKDVLNTDIGIGITGIAGPDGGSVDKPVGSVHIGFAITNGEIMHKFFALAGDREAIRKRACVGALHEFNRLLDNS